jgi:hypothetical protein
LTLFSIDRQTGQRQTAWAPMSRIFTLESALGKLAPAGDVWFGVAPRERELTEGRRGGVSDCVSIPALWLDIDVASDVHRLPGLCPTFEHARQLALSWVVPPSMVVRSGYGFQCWWCLDEPVAADEAIPLLVRWNQTWQRIANGAEVHLDNTSNIDRVMRLPGTFNHKGAEPIPVTFKGNPAYYLVGDIEAALDQLAEKGDRPRSFTGHLAGSKMNEALDLAIILELELGCSRVGTDASGDEHWHYPKSENQTSCTVYAEDHHLTIWSETMAADLGMEVRRPYDPFGFWVRLKFEGDFAAAHTWLVDHDIKDAYSAAPRPPKEPPPANLTVTRAHLVQSRLVEWLWFGWLPAGKLIILDGDPDAGKSTMTIDLAARISNGSAMPDGAPGVSKPAGVLLLSGEDDMEDTIIWRLMAAGADLNHIFHVPTALDDAGAETPVTLPRDVRLIGELIARYDIRLVIVDVLDEYLDERVDAHKNQAVRRALAPIRNLAARSGASFIMLRHMRKEGSPKAIYRGGGSIGIVGAARAGWAVAMHPEDQSMRVLAATKMNLAPRPTALAFKLIQHSEYPCASVDWRGSIEISADHLLDPSQMRGQEERASAMGVIEQCRAAIRALLSDGDMWSNELHDAIVKQLGIGARTYDTVRAELTFAWPETRPDGIRGWKVRLK